jgi:prepilin-type N-terminal cleavage/methylation domain-containing protein
MPIQLSRTSGPRCASGCDGTRRGFTVVEVLVALVIVTVGMLGVAGASAVALRASSAAIRERSAVTRARTRLALLEAQGCASAAGGELQLAAGVVDRWTVGPPTSGVRLVEMRAEWDDTRGRRYVLLQGALLC